MGYCLSEWSEGTFSVIHDAACYHFRCVGVDGARLTAVDHLDTDTSVPGRAVGALPGAVRDALRDEGLHHCR